MFQYGITGIASPLLCGFQNRRQLGTLARVAETRVPYLDKIFELMLCNLLLPYHYPQQRKEKCIDYSCLGSRVIETRKYRS